jgi:hypothetical protein
MMDDGTGSPEASVAGQDVGSPVALTIYPTRLVLPTLNRAGEKIVFESPWYYNVPHQIEPMTELISVTF